MTTTNIINMISSANEDGLSAIFKVNKISDKSNSEVFSDVLSGQKNTTAYSGKKDFENNFQSDSNEQFEKYNYKSTSIKNKQIVSLEEKISGCKEELVQISNQICDVICNQFDITEEELTQALENLGIGFIQLFEPQKLVSTVIEFSGMENPTEFLINSDFQELLNNISEISNTVLELLDVDNLENVQLDEIVSILNELDEPLLFDANNHFEFSSKYIDVAEKVVSNTNENVNLNNDLLMDEELLNNSDVDQAVINEKEVPIIKEQSTKQETFSQNESSENSDDEIFLSEEQINRKSDLITDNKSNVITFNEKMQTIEIATTQKSNDNVQSFVSVETKTIISQIVESFALNQGIDETSIQMQLNPENLGKLFINVTAKEGAVSASIVATNEVVKEALETQIIALKENLNQAGVKVDAVEVTVASHEFERHLEQNNTKDEQQAMYQEKNSNRRKNIDSSILDNQVGIMTEEETLVAKMMLENGNSIDYTA